MPIRSGNRSKYSFASIHPEIGVFVFCRSVRQIQPAGTGHFFEALNHAFYRGCQKNVPIEDRFSATNPYAAIIFSEHYYDKRYNAGRVRKDPF